MPFSLLAQAQSEIQIVSGRYRAARRRLMRVGLLFALGYWLLVGWSLYQAWSSTVEHSLDSALQASTRVTERVNLSIDLANAVFVTTDITLEQVPDPYTVKLIVKPMTLATLHIFDSLVFNDAGKERQLANRQQLTAVPLPPCPAPAADLEPAQLQVREADGLLALVYKPQHGWSPQLWLCAKLQRSELDEFLLSVSGASGLDLGLLDLTNGHLLGQAGELPFTEQELHELRWQVAVQLPSTDRLHPPRELQLPGANWLQGRHFLLSRIQGYPLEVLVQVSNRALLNNWWQQIKWVLPLSLLLMLLLLLAYLGSLGFIRALDYAATHDSLTKLFTRRHVLELALQVRALATRHKQAYGLILLDVDHFKSVNDRYGHVAGDAVLQGIAAALQQTGRKSDLIGRYGGEEFILILPVTDLAGTALAAERLRLAVSRRVFSIGEAVLPITISLGYLSDDGSRRFEDLLTAVDQALYQAKAAGRNCLVQAAMPERD